PVPAARRPHSQSGRDRARLCPPGTRSARGGDQCAGARHLHPGHAGNPERSGSFQALPGGAGTAQRRTGPAARRCGKLPGPEIEPELPRPAGAARGNREPHRGGAPRLHRGGPPLQHRAAHVSGRDLGQHPLSQREADGDLHGRRGRAPSAPGEVLMRGLRGVAVGLALLLFAALAVAQTLTFPRLTGRVVDDAGILDAGTRAALTDKLAALETKTSDQLVVATVKSLQGTSVEDYGNRLFREWKLGQAGTNNGVLLL